MNVLNVFFQFVIIVEVLVTALAVKMQRTLDPMLDKSIFGRKVLVTIVVNVVARRVLQMLFKGMLGSEISITPVTECHRAT